MTQQIFIKKTMQSRRIFPTVTMSFPTAKEQVPPQYFDDNQLSKRAKSAAFDDRDTLTVLPSFKISEPPSPRIYS
jgi:hypothetical protein